MWTSAGQVCRVHCLLTTNHTALGSSSLHRSFRCFSPRAHLRHGQVLLLCWSGTMGTGGNVDLIVPFKTKTYRDGGDAVEGGGIPMCTLRNFPT